MAINVQDAPIETLEVAPILTVTPAAATMISSLLEQRGIPD
jgi:hypothetical protein